MRKTNQEGVTSFNASESIKLLWMESSGGSVGAEILGHRCRVREFKYVQELISTKACSASL